MHIQNILITHEPNSPAIDAAVSTWVNAVDTPLFLGDCATLPANGVGQIGCGDGIPSSLYFNNENLIADVRFIDSRGLCVCSIFVFYFFMFKFGTYTIKMSVSKIKYIYSYSDLWWTLRNFTLIKKTDKNRKLCGH